MKFNLLKITIIFSFLATSLFSFEITDSRVFSIEETPTHLTSSFSLTIKEKSVNFVQLSLAKVNNIVSENNTNSICKGGNYNINPKYIYVDENRIFDGYNGTITYSCTFKDIKDYSYILNKIDDKKFEMNLNPIRWTIPKHIVDNKKDELKLKAINFGIEHASVLNPKCEVVSINLLNHNNYPIYKSEMVYSRSMKSENFSPIKEDIEISISANYKYICNTKK